MDHWYDKWHLDMLGQPVRRSPLETRLVRHPVDEIRTLGTASVPGQTLVDVGCGRGDALLVASELSLMPIGVDVSSVALHICQGRLVKRFPLFRSDAQHLPFRDGAFDFVVCLGSLEHFPDKPQAISEMSRILKKTGLALIFVPNSYFLGHVYLVWRTGQAPAEGGQAEHETLLTRSQWQRLLESSGLSVCNVWKFNAIWGSKRVSKWVRMFYNLLFAHLIPMNLSYAFVFICKKASSQGQS